MKHRKLPSCAIKSPERAKEEALLFASLKKKEKLKKLNHNIKELFFEKEYHSPLSNSIKAEFNKLCLEISEIQNSNRLIKAIELMSEKISVADLIAYQIGWGKLLLSWYQSGLKEEFPEMPGEGFTQWDYKGLANHFYSKYHYDGDLGQFYEFFEVVKSILFVVEKEYEKGNLEKFGVFDWCTLSSGKKWPLSKWINVNTVYPYKRTCRLIRAFKKLALFN